MVTLKEIAEACGVSPTTVSNVINGKAKTSEETKQRIMQVIDETGYKPNVIAQGLRSKRSKTIAIIAEDLAQFSSPAIIESIMETCEHQDYRVIVHNLRLYDIEIAALRRHVSIGIARTGVRTITIDAIGHIGRKALEGVDACIVECRHGAVQGGHLRVDILLRSLSVDTFGNSLCGIDGVHQLVQGARRIA